MAKGLYGSFQRFKDFPLDETSRFETYEAALNYCQNDKTSFHGQIISIYNDNKKAFGGENKNGIYIVVHNPEHVSDKDLLRATDSDAIDRLTQGLANLSDDLSELETKLGEDIETKLQSFATIEELNKVNKRITDLIGLSEGEQLSETLDTIKEISAWIEEHTLFVKTILDINERLGLLDARNELLSANLNSTSNIVNGLVQSVNNIIASDYISRSDAEEMIRNASYGSREVSFSTLSSQKIPLPERDLIIDKISIFLESSAPDAHFKVFVKLPNNNIRVVYISNDDENPLTGKYDTSYIDLDQLGNFLYNLYIQLPAGYEIWYEITYDQGHLVENNLKGRIGVSFYGVV